MPQLPAAFKTDEHEKIADYSALPAGDYFAYISDSEICDSKRNPDNKYWKLSFEINGRVDDPEKYKGRKLWVNLNLINDNPTAVEIANQELATITEACGLTQIEDTRELHAINMIVTLKKTPATAMYPEGNKIANYKSIGDDSPPVVKPEPKTEKKKKPWE